MQKKRLTWEILYEKSKDFNRFWLKFTPRWFEFVEWLTLIGILIFLSKKTHNILILVFFIISGFSLGMFIMPGVSESIFRPIEIKLLKRKKFSLALLIYLIIMAVGILITIAVLRVVTEFAQRW